MEMVIAPTSLVCQRINWSNICKGLSTDPATQSMVSKCGINTSSLDHFSVHCGSQPETINPGKGSLEVPSEQMSRAVSELPHNLLYKRISLDPEFPTESVNLISLQHQSPDKHPLGSPGQSVKQACVWYKQLEKIPGQHPGQRCTAVRGADNFQTSSLWRCSQVLREQRECLKPLFMCMYVCVCMCVYACVRGPISCSNCPQ